MISCIIVDDEKLALDLLESNLSRIPFMRLVGRFTNPFQAIDFLSNNPVDVMFVDVQMPEMSGLDLISVLRQKIQVIIVSAYTQYAITAFDFQVTDYLVKPVPFDRFLRACQKCRDNIGRQEIRPVEENRDYFFVYVDYSQVKINFSDIVIVEAKRDYVSILLNGDKNIVTRASMKLIEEKLTGHQFARVHKSYIINVSKIVSIKKGIILIHHHEIPLSDNYREPLSRRLGLQSD